MTRFILDKTFQANENGVTEKVDGVSRSKIGRVTTRYGEALAYMTEIDSGPKRGSFAVCPGFLKERLEKENGYEVLDLSEVPKEKQPEVKEDLEKLGYSGEFRW